MSHGSGRYNHVGSLLVPQFQVTRVAVTCMPVPRKGVARLPRLGGQQSGLEEESLVVRRTSSVTILGHIWFS